MNPYDPKLREAMAEIRSVLTKYDIGGYISLVSPTHAQYYIELRPTWAAVTLEDGILRFRVKEAEVGKERAKELSELTCHMVYQLRDLCGLGFRFTDQFISEIEKQLQVEHKPFSGFHPGDDQ